MGIRSKEGAPADGLTIGLHEDIGNKHVVSQADTSIRYQPSELVGAILTNETLGDSVSLFKKDIGETPRLTREEEAAFAARIQAGRSAEHVLQESADPINAGVLGQKVEDGLRARNELVRVNLPLVITFCKKYIGRGISMEDLIQEGNIGMIRAAETFDPTRGSFANHATWQLRGAISYAIRKQIRSKRGHYSLDAIVKEDIAMIDTIPQPDSDRDYDAVEYGAVVDEVRDTAYRILDQREFAIYQCRNDFGLTCAETGERLDLSRKRISTLEIEIRAKLFPKIQAHRDAVAIT